MSDDTCNLGFDMSVTSYEICLDDRQQSGLKCTC